MVAGDVVNSIVVNNLLPITYQISLTYQLPDGEECALNDAITIDYMGGYDCIDVPVVVSPNGDGINDTWEPILNLNTEIEVIILNRWGITELYYKGNSDGFKWDGLATNGNNLPSTDYYYIIKFNNPDFIGNDKTGVITLIK